MVVAWDDVVVVLDEVLKTLEVDVEVEVEVEVDEVVLLAAAGARRGRLWCVLE